MSQKALLFRLRISGESHKDTVNSINELAALVTTLQIKVINFIIQTKEKPDRSFLMGKGKVDELKQIIEDENIDILICDNQLSPVQQRNLEKRLEIDVYDRVAIILDIFQRRATTMEGKLQVEIARMKYFLTRLIGKGVILSRQGGGIGTKGIGETKLELDRRKIRKRIDRLEKKLSKMKNHRELQRKSRRKSGVFQVSLVGYTNAGKSTIMKLLSKSEPFVADSLFATLDPLVRRVYIDDENEILLSDTVGFIRNLPTFLIDAFRSTLEEITEASLLLNVIDLSDTFHKEHKHATLSVLAELGALDIPIITVYNKIDSVEPEILKMTKAEEDREHVFISAIDRIGIDELKSLIINRMSR